MSLALTIDGVARGWEPGTLEIEDRIRERSLLRCLIADETAVMDFSRMHTVDLDRSGITEFAGFVLEVESNREGPAGGLLHTVTAADMAYLAEMRVMVGSFQASTLRTIVLGILDTALVQEGVVGWSDQWIDLDGTGDFIKTPDSVSLSVTGNLEIRVYLAPSTWTGAGKVIASKNKLSTNFSWQFETRASGNLKFYWSSNGTTYDGQVESTVATGFGAGTGHWVAFTLDVDGGVGGVGRVTMYTWDAKVPPVALADWNQLGDPIDDGTAPTSIFDGTADVEIGSTFGGSGLLTGEVREFQMWDGLQADGGTLVANPRFDTYFRTSDQTYEWDVGDTSADDEQGNAWTLAGNPVIDRTWTVDNNGGLAINAIVFDYITCAEAFDLLCERVQFWWNIDENRVLSLFPRTTTIAPADADPATNIEAGSIIVTHTNLDYRNTQYVRGGKDTTTSQVEIFVGDGERIAFTVGFEIFAVPTVETNIAGGGYTTKTVGIRGVETGKDFYWSKGEKEITQDAGGTTLTTADLLRVTYVGLFDMVVLSSGAAEIATLAGRSGGSGRVDAVFDDASLEGRTEGFDVAAAYLAQFGADTRRLTFDTYAAGYRPGQLVDVQLADHGLDDEGMLIEEVLTLHMGGERLRYTVTCTEGPPGKSWVEFFRWLYNTKASVPSSFDELGTITILHTVSEGWGWAETSVVASVFACPVPSSTTFPSSTLFPC